MTQPIKPHPLFARFYARLAGSAMEKAGVAEHRRRLLADLTREVIEVGAGNGLNFPHYPPEVTRLVVAVEPEPNLRALAEERASETSLPLEMREARAERLPFPDASFDAAVVCLTLCSIADPHAALAELHRVLRPAANSGSSNTSKPARPRCGASSAPSTPPSGRD
ncbi:class I SAM-dependent methyltransferase [Streptomyces sp. NPDC046332]|uniref:class I SAM-dependent methyltransferase n=1 Tax=Streptomyces sp. NPDC046332 TaxID=3155133 RepID=UPI0034082C8E